MTAAAEDFALIFPGDSELARLMRGKDWTATALGDVAHWPRGLRAAVRVVLTSRFPMWMAWGDDLTMLYNDAYRRDTLGVKHPWALGQSAREVWREIWKDVGPRIDRVLATGEATWDKDLMLFLERGGYLEETYHTFSYSPLYDDDGRVRGMLCVVAEETGKLISERRVKLLGALASAISGATTRDDVLAAFTQTLEPSAPDLPFTLTYLFDGEGAARLVGTTGVAGGAHPSVPAVIDRGGDSPWQLAALLAQRTPVEIELAVSAAGPAWPSGPWAVAPTTALVVPLREQGQDRIAGFVVAAINPLRALDHAYREFVGLLVLQLAGAIANADAYVFERKRAEALTELDRAKTAFFSNVSHELRTPLTLMLGPLGVLLADGELAPELRDELMVIQRNGRRLLKLVNTMLDFSRIEAGRANARFVPVDLGPLTESLASVFRAATDRAGLRLRVECPRLPTDVWVDVDMWENIVLNLISNAFKFTLEGEIAVEVHLRGEHVVMTVADTGCGIPDSELGKIFDRFHRVETTAGRSYEGSGIGLALVQELVRLHRGSITVASTVGQGTTFTVAIPIAPPVSATDAAVAPALARASSSGSGNAGGSGRAAAVDEALRWLPDQANPDGAGSGSSGAIHIPHGSDVPAILVADDNADMRDYLRKLLGARYRVTAVANGVAALAAIRGDRPQLVVTDVMMPELDGFGLLAQIRADAELRDLPVIVLSARAGEEARIEGLAAGASEYLVKPFQARELLAHIDTQLMRAAVRAVEARQTRQLQEIFERGPVAIAIHRGPEHIYEFVNSRYRTLLPGRALIGQRLADAVTEVIGQGFVQLFDRIYATGEPYIGTATPATLAGTGGALEQRYFDVLVTPLRETTGAITGIAQISYEVTSMVTARQDAEAANRAKDEFLAMLGHELRNPLAPISTALQLMRMTPEVGALREREVIERQVEHLVRLVDDLLDVSRIARGKVELRLAAVEVADVVARAVEIVAPLVDEHHHALAVEVPRGLIIRGEASRLTQVIANLLTNAAKYTPSGGKLAVRAARDRDGAAITVTDNGIGIDAEMLPRVFEAFAQAPQTFDRARGGLGLGLAIAQNLIALHGGTIRAASAGAGHGSEFTVWLPLADAVAERAPAVVEHAKPAALKIVVVDDNIDAAEMLVELLVAYGNVARACYDGPSALAVADELVPDVAVLDLGLPGIDGFELARLLRARPALAHTRLIAVTGYGQAQDRERTRAAGFAAHLVKPVELDKLLAVLAKR